MRNRPHYAWLVCIGGGLSIFCVMGLGMNIYSMYHPYILEANGFTNTQGSWIITMRTLFSLLTTVVLGRIIEKIGLRLTLTVGVLISTLSCFLFAFSTSFAMYCTASMLGGIAFTMGGTIPLALLVSKWFRDRLSLALGLTTAASGVSTILLPPILLPIIQEQGLTAAFIFEGFCILAIAVLVFVVVRNDPSDLNLRPYEIAGGTHTEGQTTEIRGRKLTRPMLWLTLLATGLMGGPSGPGFSHVTILFANEGFDDASVALLVSYIGLVLLVSKIIYGQINDLIGGFRSNFLVAGMFLVGLFFCCLAPLQSMALALLAITFGCIGFCFASVTIAVWARDLAIGFSYSQLLRWLNITYMMGSLVMGPLPGMVADRTGSYVLAYAFFGVVAFIVFAIIQVIYIRQGLTAHPRKKAIT